MKPTLYLPVLIGLVLWIGCSDSNNVAFDLSSEFFDTKFSLTDATGQVRTTFRYGENIFFNYSLTNKANIDRDYTIPDTGPFLSFEVFRSDNQVGTSDDGLAYALVIVDSTLEGDGRLERSYNWLATPLHNVLPAGNYVARAIPRLQFQDVPTPRAQTLSFEVVCETPCDSIQAVRLTDWPANAIQLDPFQLVSVEISGDTLEVNTSHSGGCLEHDYELFMSPDVFLESFPVQANLFLRHEDHDDPCDAIVQSTLIFNVQPIADRYEYFYGQKDDIILNVFEYFDNQPGQNQSVTYRPD